MAAIATAATSIILIFINMNPLLAAIAGCR
jgi:hypothetical protein